MDIRIFLVRIMACFVLSILVGVERQYRHKMVGLRTNVLVSLGAFMFNWVSYSCNINDRTRIAAQIVSGIVFLGAGVILHNDNNKIKGLNTAATLWCVAAIGVLTSSGMLLESIIGTGLVLISNVVLRFISLGIMDKVKKNQKEICTVNISMEKDIEVVVRTTFSKYIERNNLSLRSLEKNGITKEEVNLKAIIVTTRKEEIESLVKLISLQPGVTSISWDHRKEISSDNEDTSDDED